MPKIVAIVLSGGIGSRMDSLLPKQYHLLQNKEVALFSFEKFMEHPKIDEVVVVCDEAYREIFLRARHTKPLQFAEPGIRRQDSTESGLAKVEGDDTWVLIHDAARPFITNSMIDRLIEAGLQHGASTLSIPIHYTVKQKNEKGFVEKTLDRSNLVAIQTPQFSQKKLFVKGLEKSRRENIPVTDDVSLLEIISLPVKLVLGSPMNIKLTTPEDMVFANSILAGEAYYA